MDIDAFETLADPTRRRIVEVLRFLKEDLKVKALVTGTIGGCAPLNSMAKMDWVDTHAYWQHPNFFAGAWDPAKWTIQNSPQVAVFGDRAFGPERWDDGNALRLELAQVRYRVGTADQRAVQQQLGVDEPDFGMLFDDMELLDGDALPALRARGLRWERSKHRA